MTSNQTSSAENPSVSTGRGVSLSGSTNFTGGGHTFGNNNTVDNTQDYSTHARHDNSSNKGIIGGGSNNTVISGDNSGNQWTYNRRDYRFFTSILTNGPDANERKHQLITTLPRAHAGRKVYEYKKQSGPCFKGTRQALLQEIKDWATNPNESGMYVLSGLAGIGKSTVAYTIADWADDRQHLGAEFFFSREEEDRRSAKLFFTTIAHDLYYFNQEFKQAIGEALVATGGSTAITRSPQEQLDALILHPLKPIRNILPPTLIVVDALDECDDDDARFVFMGLQRVVQALPSFKVILTTRPEALSKDDSTSKRGRKVFRLHDIDADVVDEDMRIYLNHYLSAEQVNERLPDLKTQWCASNAQVELLIQASGKLFIMASTFRYILDEHMSAPDCQIKTLLDTFAQGRTPFNNLINFYDIILRNAVPANCDDTCLVERYQAIVGTIVLSQVPLSVDSIASLMDIGIGRVSGVLRQLQSVIFVADNIPRAYHISFVDYITDSKQCEDINLRIDPTKHHTWIATRCFQMMGKHLKFNILDLGIPARFMSNEKGLAKDGISDEKLQEKIPLVLRYACAYWDGHLNGANIDDANLVKELENFENTQMLPWVEVLSLIGKLDSAPHVIRAALKVLKPKRSDLCQLLSDGLRFISKFYAIIEQSALQTYYSALLFTPTDTLLYRRYIDKVLHRGCNLMGMPNQWDAVIANFRHGDTINNVQFSFDSTMLVSWNTSGEAALKIWDAVTGTPISMIKGGGSSSQFAIANDFSAVASFKNNTITLYGVNGNEQGVTLTTSAGILDVAISSKSLSRVAAGLRDGTVCIWDIKDSQYGKPIGSFGDYPNGVEFSATGARLAYLSAKYEGDVKLWDVIKGELVANLDWGRGFAFSRDGSRIVSWKKASVKLWDCRDGQAVGTIDIGSVPDTVAISDKGSLLAIRCSKRVKLWSVNHENCLSQVGDLKVDYSWRFDSVLAFLQDDTLAIPTRTDVRLYSIKNRSFLSTLSNSLVESIQGGLAFSPDCTRFTVGYPNGTISLSDIRVIEPSSLSSNQQESRALTALALSGDCSRVACGFVDGTVELWETDDFPKRQIAAHRPHQQKITTLGFSPDGRHFASGSRDGTINLWDGENGEQRADLQYSPARSNGQLEGVEVSNSVLAAAGNHGISLWDCNTQDHIQGFDGDFTTSLSFSADGALLAAVTPISFIVPTAVVFLIAAILAAVAIILVAIAVILIATTIPILFIPVAVAAILIAAKFVTNSLLLLLVAIVIILITTMLVTVILIPIMLVAGIPIPFILVAIAGIPIPSILVAIAVTLIAAMLAAAAIRIFGAPLSDCCSITVFDVSNHTVISTFKAARKVVHMMVFLPDNPDNSQLTVWMREGVSECNILTFNLVSKKTIQGPSSDKSIQLLEMPLWYGVPVWVNQVHGQYYLEALFPQHDDPVPVLWIPRELHALEFVQRRSMIVIRCEDGHVVFLQLPTTATTGTVARADYDGNLSCGRPVQQAAAVALPYG